MLLKKPIRPSRPYAPRLPKTCGRRFLRSSPAKFGGRLPSDLMKQANEEKKRRYKETRWTKEGRDEVVNATRRPLLSLNYESRLDTPKRPAEGVDKLPLHEMTLDELVEVSALVQKRIESVSRLSSGESTREEIKTKELFEELDDELRALQEMRKENMERSSEESRSWTFRNHDSNQLEKDHFKAAEKRVEEMLARAKLPSPANATSADSVPPQALETDGQHSQLLASSLAILNSGSTGSKLSSPEPSAQERPLSIYRDQHLPEDTDVGSQRSKLARKRTEEAIEWLKAMLRKAGKLNEAPPGGEQWSILQEFEPPQKIEPLVFSQTEKAWITFENATSLHSNQSMFQFGDVLQAVQWNLRMFGPSQYIPARSTAAMDLLDEIFGLKPTSMAITLHEVNPQTLQCIMNHPWVRHNFLVGFDDKSYIFDGKLPAEVGHDDLPSVLLVSADLITDNWISRRIGQSHRELSVDLPIQSQNEQQDRRDVLRLCAARLERVVLGNRWTAFDEDQENDRKTKMGKEIDDFMSIGHNPKDRVVATVMARDLTFRHLDGSRSRQYRHKYKWWNNGALRTREARVVDFWTLATSAAFIKNMEFAKLTVRGGAFQYGINCKKNLGHISQAGPTMDTSSPLLLSEYGLQFPVRSWREVVDNDMLGWPRNVARVQRSKYWPYGPGSRFAAPHQQEQSLSELQRPPVLENMPTKDVSQEATDTVEKELPITNPEPTDDASAATSPGFNVFTCGPGFNYDLNEFGEVMMWASDDYGIARNIQLTPKVSGWFGGKRRKPKEPPPEEDTAAEVKTDSEGSRTTEDPEVGRDY